MNHKRVQKTVTGVLCGLAIFAMVVLSVCAAFLLYAVSHSSGQGLSLFGYTLFLNDRNTPLEGYSPGAAVVVQDIPHSSLQPGDYIVCRDIDIDNQFYPVIRILFAYDPKYPLTVTVETIGEGQILTVNRDDIIGKCVFSSSLLGKVLGKLQNEEQRAGLLGIALGGIGLLFTINFLWYLFLRHRAKKKAARFLPPGEPVDILSLVEPEEAELEYVEPPAKPTNELFDEKPNISEEGENIDCDTESEPQEELGADAPKSIPETEPV